MNEQIMKLSDEAYVYASEKNSIYSPQLLRDYTEKLAELIVRECVLEAMDAVHHNNSIRLQLYKHFGVEE